MRLRIKSHKCYIQVHTLVTHSINTPYHNTPYQHALSTHFINTLPYQPTFSPSHPSTQPTPPYTYRPLNPHSLPTGYSLEEKPSEICNSYDKYMVTQQTRYTRSLLDSKVCLIGSGTQFIDNCRSVAWTLRKYVEAIMAGNVMSRLMQCCVW